MTCICSECGAPKPGAMGLRIDVPGRTVSRGDRAVHLQQKVIAMVDKVAGAGGRIVTHESLFAHLYGGMPTADWPASDLNMIRVFACKANKALKGLGVVLRSAFGEGYQLAELSPAGA